MEEKADKMDRTQRKYIKSPKGKDAQKKYRGSEQGKEAQDRYIKSEPGMAAQLRYYLSEKGIKTRQRKAELNKLFTRLACYLEENPGKTFSDFLADLDKEEP